MALNGGIAYINQATTKVMVTNATGTLRRSVGGTSDSSERAAFSPDGRRIAVGPEIMNPDGSGAVRLPFSVHHPTWSPDGRRIAFIADIQASIGSPDRHRNYGTLMMAPVDNSASPAPVTDHAFIGYPAWSPDGASIAYSRDRQGATSTEIVRHQLASGRQDIIVGPQSGLPEITMAAWSPDGRQLMQHDPGQLHHDGFGERAGNLVGKWPRSARRRAAPPNPPAERRRVECERFP